MVKRRASEAEAALERAAAAFADDDIPVDQALKELGLPHDVFKGADLEGASFDHAELRNFDFSGSRLMGASFEHAVLDGVNFSGARLEGASFRSASMKKIRCARADFKNAELSGAVIDIQGAAPASLRQARGYSPKAPLQQRRQELFAPSTVRVTAQVGKTVSAAALLEAVAAHSGVSKKEAKDFVDTYVEVVKAYVLKGAKVKIGDVGMIMIRQRKARMGRNPQTGEPVKIKASKKLAFHQSAAMRSVVKV